jgi:esterase/lipase
MPGEIYLFHGRGGSPAGSVSVLENALRPDFEGTSFSRPLLLHNDPNVPAEHSLAGLINLRIPNSSTIIGISLGGLIAARLQEISRQDLTVICVSSPTWADGVRLERPMQRRMAIYSSNDEVIKGRTESWPSLADSFDVQTLTHDTDQHASLLARAITAYLLGNDVNEALRL